MGVWEQVRRLRRRRRQHLYRGQWRHEVLVRVCELEGRLGVVRAGLAPSDTVARAQVRAVERALRDAQLAAVPEPRLLARIQHWWTGAAVTRAWESVHVAEAGVLKASASTDQAEILPRLRAWLQLVLPVGEYERWYRARFADWEGRRRVDPILLRRAFQAAVAANIEWHTSLRAFRNVLFHVSGALLILLLALAGWHAADHSIFPLCCARGEAARCFGGASPWWSVLEVELVGAFAGLLGSAFLLANLEKPPTRYNVLAPQILLKAVAGAASALVGVLFVQSKVIVAPVGGSSAPVLLTYAIVFGFSQQLVTRLIDRQSANLLSPGGGRSGSAAGATPPRPG